MKKPLILYFVSEVFLSLGIGFVLYAQPFFYQSAHIGDATIGLLFGVNSLAGGVAALAFGSLADRLGASRVFKFSTLVLGLGYLFTSLTTRVGVWYFAAVLSGIGAAMLMSTENVVLSSLTQGREKASVLSKFVAMYMFVMGVGIVAAGFFSARAGYQATMQIGAAIALVAPIIRVFVKAPDAISHRLLRLPSKRVLLMSVYAMIFGVAVGIFNPFVTLVLHTQFALSDHVTALVAAAANFTVAAASFMVSLLLRHFRRERTLLFSFALSILFTIGMTLTGNATGFVSLYLLRTGVATVPGSIVDAMFLNMSHATEYSQMFGVRVFGNNAGTAIGAWSGGAFLGHHAMTWLLICSAATFAVAYAYLLRLVRHFKDDNAEVPQLQAVADGDGVAVGPTG